jgi:hypothetical protein
MRLLRPMVLDSAIDELLEAIHNSQIRDRDRGDSMSQTFDRLIVNTAAADI